MLTEEAEIVSDGEAAEEISSEEVKLVVAKDEKQAVSDTVETSAEATSEGSQTFQGAVSQQQGETNQNENRSKSSGTVSKKRVVSSTKHSDENAEPQASSSATNTTNANSDVATAAVNQLETQTDDTADFSDSGNSADNTKPIAAKNDSTSPLGNAFSSRALRNSGKAGTQSTSADRPAVDPARFINRVSNAFRVASERGGGPLRLRLSPPELGAMRIQLEIKDGVMTAHIETETAVAKTALLENLPLLQERLAEQDIRIEQFNVDVQDDSNQSAFEEAADAREQREKENRNQQNSLSSEDDESRENTSSQQQIQRPDDGSLNVVA